MKSDEDNEKATSVSTSYYTKTFGNNRGKFPFKLYEILSNNEAFGDVISWATHGNSWKIHKPEAFEEKVLPLYFRGSKFTSFMRQVHFWGFRRIFNGPDKNNFYHKDFLQSKPERCMNIIRKKSSPATDMVFTPETETMQMKTQAETSISHIPNLGSRSPQVNPSQQNDIQSKFTLSNIDGNMGVEATLSDQRMNAFQNDINLLERVQSMMNTQQQHQQYQGKDGGISNRSDMTLLTGSEKMGSSGPISNQILHNYQQQALIGQLLMENNQKEQGVIAHRLMQSDPQYLHDSSFSHDGIFSAHSPISEDINALQTIIRQQQLFIQRQEHEYKEREAILMNRIAELESKQHHQQNAPFPLFNPEPRFSKGREFNLSISSMTRSDLSTEEENKQSQKLNETPSKKLHQIREQLISDALIQHMAFRKALPSK